MPQHKGMRDAFRNGNKRSGGLAGIGGQFCTPAERDDYKAFFEPKIDKLMGAPRVFAATLEDIDQCIAIVGKQRPKADVYFAGR